MANPVKQDLPIARYLMAEMTEDERSRFEDRFLADPDLFEELIAAEDRLMRAYVREDCTASERAAFERRFLSTPEGRERVELARSMMDCVASLQGAAGPADSAPVEPLSEDCQDPKPPGGRWLTTLAKKWHRLASSGIPPAIK